jgi:hypothetical protein
MSHRGATKRPQLTEAELYPIAERYFAGQGFTVKGEVCGCDLVAVKDDTIVVAELKKTFNIKLLYQSVRRLAITDQVYAIIPKPQGRQKMSFWQMIKSLARRLNIGLLVIDGDKVMVVAEPGDFTRRVLARHRSKVLKEFHGRRVSKNIGGVRGVQLKTAYLESAIHISVLLKKHKAMQPAQLVREGAAPNARQILYNNYYDWFEKSARGLYKLKPGKARVIAKENPTIWRYYERLVEQKS